MKEYIIKRKNIDKYEYGYRIQNLDIELMVELGIVLPNKLKKLYGKGFLEKDLPKYVYINDSLTVDFLGRQYYIRDYVEFANLNLFELNLLLNYYKKIFQEISIEINNTSNKDELNNLRVDMNILINDMLSIIYLKENMFNKENKKMRK